MSLVEDRHRCTWFLSVLCLAGWGCAALTTAIAQERNRPSASTGSPSETSSQRLLPLPAGTVTDLNQQVEWLQQLRGLLAAGSLGSDASEAPKFDPEQLRALLNAMQQLSNMAPQGTVLPKSEKQSSEQLFKMLANPAVQDQVRQLLGHFSQNGKLPPGVEPGDSKSVPMPSGSTPRAAGPTRNLSAMPPTTQELMKRLLQQVGRPPNETSTGDPPSEDQKLKPASPHRERVESVAAPQTVKSKPSGTLPNSTERSFTQPRVPEFRDDEANANLERARSELEAIMRDPRNELNLPPRASETNRKPVVPPTLGHEKVDAGNGVSKPSRSPPETPIHESPAAPPPSTPAVTQPIVSDSPKSPPLDVRSELQQNGFTQTLRKLIDQTRAENRAESNGAAGTSAAGQDAAKGSLSGLEKSIARLIDGLRKDTARATSGAPQQSATPTPTTTAAAQPSTPPSRPERRPTAGKVLESVGKVIKEMAAAPDARPGNARPRQGRSASGPSDSQRATSGSTGPLLMLLAVLGLAWYFLPRVVTAVKESPLLRRSSWVGELTASADIRTRQDVVRAFHQYALQSAVSVQNWWTHREVERQVAGTTPTLKPSIQVLADVYELARYLPDDAELTPDQIGLVRREFDNVSKANGST